MTTSSGLDGVAMVIVGVDTHLDEHVAVAIDHHGARLGEYRLATTAEGYEDLERYRLIWSGAGSVCGGWRATRFTSMSSGVGATMSAQSPGPAAALPGVWPIPRRHHMDIRLARGTGWMDVRRALQASPAGPFPACPESFH